MKTTKIVSIITAIVMSICMTFGTFSSSAAETQIKFYTLDELLAMSDEEFLAIPEEAYGMTAEYCFSLTEDVSKAFGYTFTFAAELINKKVDFEYISNITENEISELIGNTIEYSMSNIAIIDHEPYYADIFMFYIYESEKLMADKSTKDINMMLAKMMYCVRQIIPVTNMEAVLPRGDDYKEPVITGDVNFDKSVNLYDVIWIASDLVGIFKLTEVQQEVGDINEDGMCNLYDAIEIAKTLM